MDGQRRNRYQCRKRHDEDGRLGFCIGNSAANDTVSCTVPNGTTISTGSTLTIDHALQITGLGVNNLTVARSDAPATPKFSVFAITAAAGNVTLEKFRIVNGNGVVGANKNGGGIGTATNLLTLNDAKIDSNTTDSDGGGIYVNGNANLTLRMESVAVILPLL